MRLHFDGFKVTQGCSKVRNGNAFTIPTYKVASVQ